MTDGNEIKLWICSWPDVYVDNVKGYLKKVPGTNKQTYPDHK